MTDILQFLQHLGARAGLFPLSSRYKDTPTSQMEGPNGPIVFLRRRFLPKPENFSLLQEHVVQEKDRLDNIANQYLGDPERYWQICDANNVMNPDDLTAVPDTKIKITLPAGIPGNPNA